MLELEITKNINSHYKAMVYGENIIYNDVGSRTV